MYEFQVEDKSLRNQRTYDRLVHRNEIVTIVNYDRIVTTNNLTGSLAKKNLAISSIGDLGRIIRLSGILVVVTVTHEVTECRSSLSRDNPLIARFMKAS